jgi:hypothetical protein
MTIIPALRRLRQEVCKSKASLSHLVRPYKYKKRFTENLSSLLS